VRTIAADVEQEGKKITSLISTIETGWTGAGASAYINYLEALRVNIFERSQKLYSIANALEGSATAAEEADIEAARKIAEANAAAQSVSQSQQPDACPPQTPVCEPNNTAPPKPEEVVAAANNIFNNVFDTMKNTSKTGRKR
ncbi:MAG: WXG100 family type VII secretion target, partial [Oscillospiraceae bacterium]|nr:WXG100 family type VII secretion target [Oscillospiraceae bacterium]